MYLVEASKVQSLSRVQLFATPWIAARQASLSITISRRSLRLTTVKSVMPSSHLIRKVISLTDTKISRNFWDLIKGRIHLDLLGKICDKALVWVSQPCFILKVQSEILYMFQISSVQSLSRVRLFATPWIAAHQASLSIINSQSSLRFMYIESVMPSSHLV